MLNTHICSNIQPACLFASSLGAFCSWVTNSDWPFWIRHEEDILVVYIKSLPTFSLCQNKLDASCRKRQLSPHPATPNPAVVPKSDFIQNIGQIIIIVISIVFLQKLLWQSTISQTKFKSLYVIFKLFLNHMISR